ncbi:GNAT family N-acetyltransferase [Hyphobacterium sp.]|jgi:putative acetyltransferase|uniref:GNAT family N-acetyltransferase n=1 Tax=Hyphobacterium sp. TaxID=2004662 RepID=UPI003BAA3C81
MQIRTAGEDDHAGIAAVLTAAFAQPDEADIVAALRDDDADSLELVADHHGRIIGTVMFSPASAELSDGRILRGLGLGPVAVAPGQQSKGIGTALIEAGLEHFKPYPVAFFCVLGEPDYYARFGFTPAIERGWTWQADDGSIPEIRDAFQIVIPRDLPSGTGIVRYHPAFGTG